MKFELASLASPYLLDLLWIEWFVCPNEILLCHLRPLTSLFSQGAYIFRHVWPGWPLHRQDFPGLACHENARPLQVRLLHVCTFEHDHHTDGIFDINSNNQFKFKSLRYRHSTFEAGTGKEPAKSCQWLREQPQSKWQQVALPEDSSRFINISP